MNEQEIFNKVYDHFVTKGQPRSIDDEGSCLYRGPDGAKCAAGLLIPDSHYSPELENVCPGSERIDKVLAELGLAEHSLFLANLQTVHDNAIDDAVAGRLRNFAADNDLEIQA